MIRLSVIVIMMLFPLYSMAQISGAILPFSAASRCLGSCVPIAAGASLQNAVNANPSGTSFQLASGNWSGQLLNMSGKDGDSFYGYGVTNTILDGGGQLGPMVNGGYSGFGGTQTSNIKFYDMTIRNYAQNTSTDSNPAHKNTCAGFGSPEIYTWTGWVLDNVRITGSKCIGIQVESSTTLSNSVINSNGMTGIEANSACLGPSGTQTIIGNEIGSNNTRGIGIQWDAAGLKGTGNDTCPVTTTIQNNWVHDNNGVGLWCDVRARNWTITGNTVINSQDDGVRYETCYGGTITHNVLNNNALRGGAVQAGVYIADSSHVSVDTNNVLVPNVSGAEGIFFQSTTRSDHQDNDNLTQTNDTVTFVATTLGYDGWYNTGSISTSGNSSNNNHFYDVNTTTARFLWGATSLVGQTFSAYQGSTGQDAASTITIGNASVSGCTRVGCAGSGW